MSSEESRTEKSDPKEECGKEDDIEPDKVHSANKWEKVDLGDDDRKKKFLRLMGAAKKEHHGRFVIGEEHMQPHDRDSPEKEIEAKLEDQFKQGLEHKLIAGPKAHIGLGFHDDPKKNDGDAEGDKATKKDSDGNENGEQNSKEKNKTEEKTGEKHKLEDKLESEMPLKKKFMSNFVKASDS